jgi:tetratricopeptide (TPR) repeat protein
LLKQLVRLKPKDSRFWLLLGNVVLSQDRPLDAIAQLEIAHSLGVLEPEGVLILGDLYASSDMNPEAVRVFQSIATKTPNIGVERMARLAEALTNEGDLAGAGRVLEAAAAHATGKDRAAILLARSGIHLSRKEWKAAQPLLESVIELDPLNGRALIDLGTVEEELGEDSQAVILFESATRVPEQAYAANLKLANLQVKLQQYADALASIDRALALQKSNSLVEFRARVRAMAPDAE